MLADKDGGPSGPKEKKKKGPLEEGGIQSKPGNIPTAGIKTDFF